MNLSDRTIRILLRNGVLRIEPHTDAMIQPSGVDLSLGDSLLVWPKEVLCDPRIDQTDVWQPVQLTRTFWVLEPGYRYLTTTSEEIALASNITAQISARSKWGRCGLNVIQGPAGFCDAGYHGRPTLELSVVGSDLVIWPGAGCLQLILTWQDKHSERPYGSDGLGSHYQGDTKPTPARVEVARSVAGSLGAIAIAESLEQGNTIEIPSLGVTYSRKEGWQEEGAVTVFGYCTVGRADEPLGPDKLCSEHRMVGIPPTWGKRTWKWLGVSWEPYTPRPEGYVYRPRFPDEQPAPKPVTAQRITPTVERPTHCLQCGELLTAKERGGSVQRYCPGGLCKQRAYRDRRRKAVAS